MRKIPTLFKREFEGHKIINVLPDLTDPSLQWVLDGEGIATVKWDGACCAIIDGEFYKRYDAKNGKPVPEGAIKCQDEADPITGHLPCWVKVDPNDPSDKWFVNAKNSLVSDLYIDLGAECWMSESEFRSCITKDLKDRTYEAVGKHFNSNPYNMERDILIPHGTDVITDELGPDWSRTFEGIKKYLEENYIEGIVFWKDGEPKCKIKRIDFGFSWGKGRRR